MSYRDRINATVYGQTSRTVRRKTVEFARAPGDAILYLMRDALGNTKVGKTICADARLATIKTMVRPERRPVRLYRAIKMCQSVVGLAEREAHRRLAGHAIGGEWFAIKPKDCEQVVMAAAEAIVDGKRHVWRPPPGHVKQKGVRGTKPKDFTPEQIDVARQIWENVRRYPSWESAQAGFDERVKDFTVWRANRMFGKR